jgi:hypothetical protein
MLLRSILSPWLASSQRIRSRADCKSGLVISRIALWITSWQEPFPPALKALDIFL